MFISSAYYLTTYMHLKSIRKKKNQLCQISISATSTVVEASPVTLTQ